MTLRYVWNRATLRLPKTPTRSFSLNTPQGPSHNLVESFSERFSARPDAINTLMNLIYTQAPQNSVTPFNLFCRSAMERWTVKGLRVGNKHNLQKRSVVVASGIRAYEHITVGIALYVAAVLSRRPISGVEVTFFPILKPKEYEAQWLNEQTEQIRAMFGMDFNSSENPTPLSTEEHERAVEGPLRSYVMKRGSHFVDVVMDMNNTSTSIQLKQNSIVRQLRQASVFLQNAPEHPYLPSPSYVSDTVQANFEQLVTPPTIILELRDKSKKLSEDNIISRGEEVLSTIHKLLAETEGNKVL
jgi:hypothetical protein